MPSARGVRAKLLEKKLAARRREFNFELETLACGSDSHPFLGKLSAAAKDIRKVLQDTGRRSLPDADASSRRVGKVAKCPN